MKPIATLLLLTAANVLGDPADYYNFLRQTQISTNVQWDMPVGEAGTMISPYALGTDGSFFELWSVHIPSGKTIALDQRLLGETAPRIRFEIETGDPYVHTKRTRADQPFTVRLTTSGIPAPVLKKMHFEHLAVLFPKGVFAMDPSVPFIPQLAEELEIKGNGVVQIKYPRTNLRGSDLTKVSGIEYFTMGALVLNNGNGNNSDSVDISNGKTSVTLDPSGGFDDETLLGGKYTVRSLMRRGELQVWPVADGSISGVEHGVRYQTIPPISIELHDLYPDSTTYVRVYRGGPGAPLGEPITIGSASVIVRDAIPQDRTLVIEDLGYYLTESGSYTLEVLHDTPFGTDILTRFHPLEVDYNLNVRGAVYSAK